MSSTSELFQRWLDAVNLMERLERELDVAGYAVDSAHADWKEAEVADQVEARHIAKLKQEGGIE